jgi:tyrosine-protein kinase Etk/Wzc
MTTSDSLPQQEHPSSGFVVFRQIITRHARMILAITALSFVTAVVVALLLPSVYCARAMLLPAQEEKGMMNAMLSQMGGLVALAGGALGGGSTSDIYVGMLKSETVKDPIIDRFKLMQVYGKKYRTDTYSALDKRVSILAGKKDGIISISVDDRDPKRAADMANAFVEELQKLTVTLNMSGAGKNRSFLEERLIRAKADLVKAEEELKAFQGKNKTINVSEQTKATIEGVARLKAELAAQEVQLSSQRRTLTDSTREVKDLKITIVNLKSQISSLEGAGGAKSAIPSVGSIPILGQDYARLIREFKIQENLVELLTKQYEMARFSEAKDVAPIQVLQKARVPDKRIRPRTGFIVIISTVLALIFSVILCFVFEAYPQMSEIDKSNWKDLFNMNSNKDIL